MASHDHLARSPEAVMLCKISAANLLWTRWRSDSQNDKLFQEAVEQSQEVIYGDLWKSVQGGELLDRYTTLHSHLLEVSSIRETWFTNQEVFKDLDAALKTASLAYRGLLPRAPQDVKERTIWHIGAVSRTMFEWAGNFNDISRALAAVRLSLANYSSKPGQIDRNWSRCAMRLANISLYHDQDDFGDEAQALLKIWLALSEKVVGPPARGFPCEKALCFLTMSEVSAKIWHRRCSYGDGLALLDSSIDFAEKAVAIVPERDELLSEYVDAYSLAYYARYSSPTRKAGDLDKAVASATRAVGLGPHNYSDVNKAPMVAERMTVVSIGIASNILAARYLRDGHPSDLEASIRGIEMLLKLLPLMHPRRPHALQTRRDLLELKYERCLARNNTEREENLLKRWAFKVRGSLSATFKHLGESDLDIIRGVARLKRLRSRSSPSATIGRRQLPASMLGHDLIYHDFTPLTHYARGSYPADLKLSTDKPGLCVDGSAMPFKDGGIMADLKAAFVQEASLPPKCHGEIMTELEGIEPANSSTAERVMCMLVIGSLLFRHRQFETLQVIWRFCFGTLDALALHEMRASHYQRPFRRLAALAVMVASSMLTQDDADIWSVILVLERGREVLNSLNFLSTRSQRIKFSPYLERQAEELVADMKNPGLEPNAEFNRSEFRHLPSFERRSRELFKTMQDLIESERHIEPFSKDQIIQQSRGGPIVMLIATPIGAHALLVTPSNSHAIALKGFKYGDAVEKSRAARLALSQCEQDQSLVPGANRELRQYLKWLWDTVVFPIVRDLALVPGKPVEELPRIQWVCCGIFSRLPIHAAGNYIKPRRPHLAQYAVSSYLSSVRYTTMAKRKHPYLRPGQSQILVVTMPQTEGNDTVAYGDLDTKAESLAIKNNLPKSLNTTFLTNPDMGSIQSLLGGARVAHFSCHGVVDTEDPLKSRLIIRYDNQNPLTVVAIRDLSTSFSRLAFLSACHSSNFEDMSTADEVVHVAKAFQLAGFPSVVGTLWQAFDQDSAIVAGGFYAYIAKRLDGRDDRELDGDLIARALHSATGRLRDRNTTSCANWASWIHYGD